CINKIVLFELDILPKNGSEVFFSRGIYEKYSLAPSLSELWLQQEKFRNLWNCVVWP
uniref:Uncharacterized protein n=1 Tax=Bubo bubo TaxID=30461 RepID=A0A8C0EAP8_BUBBB